MSNIDHIILYLFLFAVFINIPLHSQEKIHNNYWKVLLVPIIAYILILGLRYGWGTDYEWYKYQFTHPLDWDVKSQSKGFLLTNKIISLFGNYVIAFIVYSLFFIIGAFFLLRNYNENKYMLALFLPATLLLSTFTIRQSFATSFAFVALYAIHNKKWWLLMSSSIIIYFLHPGALLIIAVPAIFYFTTKEKTLPWTVMVGIYICSILLSSFLGEYISDKLGFLFSMITIEDQHYSGYVEKSNLWFSLEGNDEKYRQSTFAFIMSFLFECGVLIISKIGISKKPNIKVAYFINVLLLSLVYGRIFFLLEIPKRIAGSLFELYFIPLGYGLYVFLHNRSLFSKNETILCCSCIGLIALYLILYFGRFIFMSPDYIFIWDV